MKRNWTELTSAKTSGIVTGDKKNNWSIADQSVFVDNPRSLWEN